MKFRFIVFPFFLILAFILLACEKNYDIDRTNYGAHRLPPIDSLKFTPEEIALINSGDSATRFQILLINQQPDSLILRSRSRDIRLTEKDLKLLTDRMHSTVKNPANPGVGIAAPQVGINRRIVWVQRYDKTGRPWEVFVNIRITNMSDTVKPRNDGCLSIPGVSGKSLRAIWCEVEYDLPDGSRVTERIDHQYTAHIFQHEIDHLDGIIWTDRKPTNKLVIIDGDPDEYEGEIMPRID